MQIFLPYIEPIEAAKVLDSRRLNKQILECSWILDAHERSTHARFHPIYKMYCEHLEFVRAYRACLVSYRAGDCIAAQEYSIKAVNAAPEFVKTAQFYLDNFKSRLYTKNPVYYKQFEQYGISHSNYYYVAGEWKEYKS